MKQGSAKKKQQTKPVLNVISISIGLVCIVTRQIGSFFLPNSKKRTRGNTFWRCVEREKNLNLEMERMIKQQIFALEMDALTNRLQRLQLDKKIVTLLHELWDKMKIGGQRKVEVKTNEDGMEVIIIIGELMVPTFYFTNEKKFWRQLRFIIKSSYCHVYLHAEAAKVN